MAIVRHRNPNLAELSIYRSFLDRFDLTFFFSGWDLDRCRSQLDGFGLQRIKIVRYKSVSDLFPSRQ
jgi:hypothetical protein